MNTRPPLWSEPHGFDRDLVRRLLAGADRAFDQFIGEYYPRLYRFAYPRVGSDPDSAQDVVQGTFEKVIPKLASYRGEAPLFSWLCTFCRYEIAAYWRQRGKAAPELSLAEDGPAVQAALESLAALADGPEDIAARRQLATDRVTLDHLPPTTATPRLEVHPEASSGGCRRLGIARRRPSRC
jgi:RNA polymerase sigma-70 factor (ECF subfamily)